ncbi:MAG: hypothetical protein J6Y05_10130 [Bacteroidales bacterium]|nr:hypothetical protein [Bacteroidales bacterium]
MKKFLLLVAAATLTLSTTAATRQPVLQTKINPASEKVVEARQVTKLQSKFDGGALRAKSVVTPEGTAVDYGFSSYNYKYMKVEARFSEDGTKVFFDNMFPEVYSNGDVWVQGNISTDGTRVTFPKDLYIGELTDVNEGVTYSVLPIEILVDENYYVTGYEELVFVKDGDKIYIDDDLSNPSRFIGLGAVNADGEIDGFFSYDQAIAYEPYVEPVKPELVQLPEGAEPVQFLYTSYDEDLNEVVELKMVYVDGNDVYMSGLATDLDADAWVKGTKDGNTVTFPSGQYVGEVDFYGIFSFEMYFVGLTSTGERDEYGYLLYNIADSYTLTYDPEKNVYTNSDLTTFAGTLTDDYSVWSTRCGFNIEPYAGDVPAVPSDPYDLSIDDYTADYEQYRLNYTIDPVDVDGNFINPANLGYYIYLDGEQYTLTPDVFVELTEDMDLIPYTFSDSWDIYNYCCYIGEELFTTLGVQTVYTVDGETNYSNVVSVDMEGNVTTVPAPQLNPDGLNNVNVKKVTSVEIYDAQGRKLEAAQQGVNVVKMVAADGSVKTIKMYKK